MRVQLNRSSNEDWNINTCYFSRHVVIQGLKSDTIKITRTSVQLYYVMKKSLPFRFVHIDGIYGAKVIVHLCMF